MTYKNQLILAFLSFSTVVGLLFIGIIDYSVKETEDHILQRYLKATGDSYQAESDELPAGVGISSYFANDKPLPENVDVSFPGMYELKSELRNDHFVYVKVIPGREIPLIVELDGEALSDLEQKELPIFGVLLGMAGLLQLFSWLIAIVTAWFLARPVVSLIEGIQTNSRTKTQLYGHHRDDEIGQLSRGFSHLLSLERSFSAHVSHEFRSSLMLIKLAVANIRQVHKTQQPQQLIEKNCDRIELANQQMTDNIELFLQLGSDMNKDQQYELVDVTEIFHETEQYSAALRNSEQLLQLAVDDAITLMTSPVFLQVLFRNTLQNAIEHGSGAITVKLTQAVYRVSNTIDHDLANSGSGYGLEIVKRVCEHNNWQLEIGEGEMEFSVEVRFWSLQLK